MPLDLNTVDPRFVDADFTREAAHHGYSTGFGGIGPQVGALRSYGDVVPEMSESEIRAAIDEMDANDSGAEFLVTRIYDQNGEGSCFPPGSLVTMATGELRPIEDVKCLESVITAEGNVGQVRQAMARPYIGQVVGIHLHGHNLVRCTPEHPILTRRGYVAARELTAIDYVAIPKVRPAEVKSIQTASYMPYRHRCSNELRIQKFGAPEGRTLTQIQIQPIPDVIELDAKFGRILGLFLAEGNCDKQKIVWTFNIKEADTLAAELRTLLADKFGVETKVRIAGARTTIKVEMYGTLWARLFEGLCSTGSGAKRLCAELAGGSAEFLRAVFDGWMSGDGYRAQRTNTGVTISRQLAVQMFQIGTRLGLMPAIRRSEPKPSHGVRIRQPRYDLTFGDGPDDNYRRDQDERHCWRKVRILTLEDYNGPVHNLHVHGDESYVADGLGVHNCVANAFSQGTEVLQALQFGKAAVVHLSAMSLYKRIGSGPNSGANVGDGLDECQGRGVLPLDNPENRAKFADKVMPNCGWRTPYPSGWETVAADFVVKEAYVAKSVNQVLTGLCKRKPVIVGRAGHSICYTRPAVRNGSLGAVYANSWSLGWGFAAGRMTAGFGFDSGGTLRAAASWAVVLNSLVTPAWRL